MADPHGPKQPPPWDADFERHARGELAERRYSHGSRGWSKPIPVSQVGGIPQSVQLVNDAFDSQGCIALACTGSTCAIATFTVGREGAIFQRKQVVIPQWGIAMPCGCGAIQIDVSLIPTIAAPTPGQYFNVSPPGDPSLNIIQVANAQQQFANGAWSYGVPVPEDLPDVDVVLNAGANTTLVPPDFTRTVTLAVRVGALTSPVLAAGQQITLGVAPTTGGKFGPPSAGVLIQAGLAGATVSVIWGILAP